MKMLKNSVQFIIDYKTKTIIYTKKKKQIFENILFTYLYLYSNHRHDQSHI